MNAQVVESEEVVPTKPIFSSSDEEESNENENIRKKSRNKRKQHTLVYSGKKMAGLIYWRFSLVSIDFKYSHS